MLKKFLYEPFQEAFQEALAVDAKGRSLQFWFGLSFLYPLYCGLVSLAYALHRPYIVQDDARQHIFWMHRFVDPSLFPNDLIADYFQTINPAGYKAFYAFMAQLGVEPLLLAKLMPLVLGLIASAYGFGIAMQLLPLPLGAFVSTLILNQGLWMRDEIITGTSRAFLYPLFLAFVYYLLRRSLLPCLISLALQALFYPPLGLVAAGTVLIRLIRWQDGKLSLSRQRLDYGFGLGGAGIVVVLVLAFFPKLGDLGPMVTAAQMRSMPEFGAGGRLGYFDQDFWQTWVSGDSAIFPRFIPWTILLSLLLPILWRSSSPLIKPFSSQILPRIKVLWQILAASLCLFLLAHLILPRLYFPSRFTGHSFWFVMVFCSGMAVTLLLAAGRQWWLNRQAQRMNGQPLTWKQRGAIALSLLLLSAAITIPALPSVFLRGQSQIIGGAPRLYQFFAQKPKDILIASLAEEVDNIPTFSRRSILVSKEYALPFHSGYYQQIRQRAIDLIAAQYSPSLTELQGFIQKYQIDYFLVDRNAFTPEAITQNPGLRNWLMQFQPTIGDAIARLERKEPLAIVPFIQTCSVLKANQLSVLDAKCILGSGE
ncbi:MAG: hypothetical protein MUF49_14530 [Oculatellaceae cyanobacterium Prado106]|jgi:hypothetical protein|nr:hypothetical protein [Oculatellaceae cyanobacterium Prado106]